MATTKFIFQESEEVDERTDIKLCANRWDLFKFINEIDVLARQLYNGKYYHSKVFYPVGEKGDMGENCAKEYRNYSLNEENGNGEEGSEYVEVERIADDLSQALNVVRHILDD